VRPIMIIVTQQPLPAVAVPTQLVAGRVIRNV
jgi:hypothetical protein